jgi:hypothetical protein
MHQIEFQTCLINSFSSKLWIWKRMFLNFSLFLMRIKLTISNDVNVFFLILYLWTNKVKTFLFIFLYENKPVFFQSYWLLSKFAFFFNYRINNQNKPYHFFVSISYLWNHIVSFIFLKSHVISLSHSINMSDESRTRNYPRDPWFKSEIILF